MRVFTVWEIQPFRLGRNVRVSCSEIRSEQAENDAQSDFLSLRADFTSALFKVVLIHKMATNWAVGHVMVRLLSNLVLLVLPPYGNIISFCGWRRGLATMDLHPNQREYHILGCFKMETRIIADVWTSRAQVWLSTLVVFLFFEK